MPPVLSRRSYLKQLGLFSILTANARVGLAASIQSRKFISSDGVELHYSEAGSGKNTLIFVPGWMMPADVFVNQLNGLSKTRRVIAFDPRSQGRSQIATSHSPDRRCKDLVELIKHTAPGNFVLAGWSLGVMEVLDLLTRYKSIKPDGIILIDNSIGEGQAPGSTTPNKAQPSKPSAPPPKPINREAKLFNFVKGLTSRPLDRKMFKTILDSAVRMPEAAARETVNKPYPREYYRDAVLARKCPVLYAVRPRLEGQARLLEAKRPKTATIEIFPNAGHAIFLDEPQRFNAVVDSFLRKIW